jgi:hypothetical protein
MAKTAGELAEYWMKQAEPCCNECYKDGFLAGYKAAAPQWISVQERLPEEDVTVLVFINYSIDDAKLLRVVSGAYRGKLWLCGQDIYSERFITHWMPLPSSPEVKHED